MSLMEKINGVLIHKDTPIFKGLSFVLEARTKDEARPSMKYLHVERTADKVIFVATDGRRLHIAFYALELDIGEGNYEATVCRDFILLYKAESTGMDFPSWRQVLPNNNQAYEMKFADKTGMRVVTEWSCNLCTLNTVTGQVFDIELLTALRGLTWTIYFDRANKGKATVFQSGNMYAVVMPLNYEESTEKPRVENEMVDYSSLSDPVQLGYDGEPVVVEPVKKRRRKVA
jgi:hypothetical protein